MNKHTPGPWVADLASFKVCANEGKLEICRTYGGVRIAEEHANARLIAASPDMLDALQAIVDAFGDQNSLLIDQCKAALNKATGKQ